MQKSKRKTNKYRQIAQSTLEYAVVIACITGALIAMQFYVKRSIQGRLREAADEIGEQYSAKHTTSDITQVITNPADKPVTITAKPVFKEVEVIDRDTGLTRKERYEIMEVTRKENITMEIKEGSQEETAKLSDENLFD